MELTHVLKDMMYPMDEMPLETRLEAMAILAVAKILDNQPRTKEMDFFEALRNNIKESME